MSKTKTHPIDAERDGPVKRPSCPTACEGMTDPRRCLLRLCEQPELEIELRVKLPTDEWMKLQLFANRKGWSLLEAVQEILSSSDEVLNPEGD